jgi:hypothetical protein
MPVFRRAFEFIGARNFDIKFFRPSRGGAGKSVLDPKKPCRRVTASGHGCHPLGLMSSRLSPSGPSGGLSCLRWLHAAAQATSRPAQSSARGRPLMLEEVEAHLETGASWTHAAMACGTQAWWSRSRPARYHVVISAQPMAWPRRSLQVRRSPRSEQFFPVP